MYNYPTELSPPSKTKFVYPETIERFELYIAGISAQTPNRGEQF
jgi:lysyl-tRNA synthetase class II